MTQCQVQGECTRQWEMTAFRVPILGNFIRHPKAGEIQPSLSMNLAKIISVWSNGTGDENTQKVVLENVCIYRETKKTHNKNTNIM